MNRSIKRYTHHPDPWPSLLYVYVHPDAESVRESGDLPENGLAYAARKGHNVHVHVPVDVANHTIAHESTHAALHMLRSHGFETMAAESEEAIAYLLGWCFAKIEESIERYKKQQPTPHLQQL